MPCRTGPDRQAGGLPLSSLEGYKFIGFGVMEVTKPYEFIGFGAMDVTKLYKFIGFGAMEVTKADVR